MRLVTMAFLIALEIVLTRFCSINTPILRIGFGFLPVAMMGIMFGPLWAGIGYAVGDLLGMLIFPSGAYFPGFTLTAFLTGLVFGFFLHGKEITWKKVLPAALWSFSVSTSFLIRYGFPYSWVTGSSHCCRRGYSNAQ